MPESYYFVTRKFHGKKKNTNLFDVAMGAYDGADVCETVGLLLVNN